QVAARIAIEDERRLARDVQLDVAPEMNRPGREPAGRHDDASSAGACAFCDRATDRLRRVRPTVAYRAEPRDIELSIRKRGRLDAREDLRHDFPSAVGCRTRRWRRARATRGGAEWRHDGRAGAQRSEKVAASGHGRVTRDRRRATHARAAAPEDE